MYENFQEVLIMAWRTFSSLKDSYEVVTKFRTDFASLMQVWKCLKILNKFGRVKKILLKEHWSPLVWRTGPTPWEKKLNNIIVQNFHKTIQEYRRVFSSSPSLIQQSAWTFWNSKYFSVFLLIYSINIKWSKYLRRGREVHCSYLTYHEVPLSGLFSGSNTASSPPPPLQKF